MSLTNIRIILYISNSKQMKIQQINKVKVLSSKLKKFIDKPINIFRLYLGISFITLFGIILISLLVFCNIIEENEAINSFPFYIAIFIFFLGLSIKEIEYIEHTSYKIYLLICEIMHNIRLQEWLVINESKYLSGNGGIINDFHYIVISETLRNPMILNDKLLYNLFVYHKNIINMNNFITHSRQNGLSKDQVVSDYKHVFELISGKYSIGLGNLSSLELMNQLIDELIYYNKNYLNVNIKINYV